MAEDNIVQKIKRWKPMSKRPIGRPETRWEDDVLEGITSTNIGNWKKVALPPGDNPIAVNKYYYYYYYY